MNAMSFQNLTSRCHSFVLRIVQNKLATCTSGPFQKQFAYNYDLGYWSSMLGYRYFWRVFILWSGIVMKPMVWTSAGRRIFAFINASGWPLILFDY